MTSQSTLFFYLITYQVMSEVPVALGMWVLYNIFTFDSFELKVPPLFPLFSNYASLGGSRASQK